MLKRFYPDEYMNSTYEIDFAAYKKAGYCAVIFDVDNTLVPHGAKADERSKILIEQLKSLGFGIMLLSNNKKERVASFNEELQVSYIYKANKPFIENYIKAMEILKSNTSNTLFVGDQLFTDIWGAKKAGIPTILVKPIHPKEEIQIVLKRLLEKIVLFFYEKQKNK